jgi:hypothetical protein
VKFSFNGDVLPGQFLQYDLVEIMVDNTGTRKYESHRGERGETPLFTVAVMSAMMVLWEGSGHNLDELTKPIEPIDLNGMRFGDERCFLECGMMAHWDRHEISAAFDDLLGRYFNEADVTMPSRLLWHREKMMREADGRPKVVPYLTLISSFALGPRPDGESWLKAAVSPVFPVTPSSTGSTSEREPSWLNGR